MNDEAALWKARANQHWLREGDNNTKYFHSIANGRRRANEIGVVSDDGRVYQSEEDKKNYFSQYFKHLYTPETSAPLSFGDWSGLFTTRRVSDQMGRSLSEKFSADEIKTAVFQLGSDKAPGPDGFLLRFYQIFWEAIKGDLLNVFQELYEDRISTSPIDYSFICLIPKRKGAARANEFRPISLINGLQKIISKVLANRLAIGMGELVSPSQSAFLKGRNITDAFVGVRSNWMGV